MQVNVLPSVDAEGRAMPEFLVEHQQDTVN